ncbi:hypothetical protein Dsin_017704 [Dipteronia sinensis]|uniref:Squalene monooxygenase n=1 Tax=Dipteronia sinensis TaxID=43782 RepID=A0AAE0AGG4_9ROSI|nr:hypothetical protein Dsin_017704 [Dipteronia sinensis]
METIINTSSSHRQYDVIIVGAGVVGSALAYALAKVHKVSHLVGWVAENYELPHANHGHVVILDPCAVLIYSISSTEIPCFVDVFGQNLPSISTGEMSHYLKFVVALKVLVAINS